MTAAEDLRELRAENMKEDLRPVIEGLNSMSGLAGDALALAVMAEHPTLAGQLARAVAIGIMRRVTRDPDWKPWAPTPGPRCSGKTNVLPHPEHDGRFSCELVVGAELMARQGFI